MALSASFFGQHPAVTAAIVWLLAMALARLSVWRELSAAAAGRIVAAASLATLAAFAAIVVWYVATLAYFDPAEPTITAVASVFLSGRPLYPALDAPERYVHIYGPALFIVHAGAMALLGSTITVSKAVGGSAILAALLLMYRQFAHDFGRSRALPACAMCALIFLCFGNAAFWTRSEPLLILTTVAALWAVGQRHAVPAALLLGVATGVAVNLKVTGPIYLIPVFVLFARRRGLLLVSAAAALAAVIGVLPFLLPNVSATAYVDYIRLSARNGLLLTPLKQNLEWLALGAIPIAIAWLRGRREASASSELDLLVLGLAGSLGAIAVIGAKPGGGPFHFLPAVPVVAYTMLASSARTAERSLRLALIAVAITLALIAVPRQIVFVRTMADRHLSSALDDVRQFAAAHPASRIAVGYAGTSYLSQARVELVFRSGDYLLDAPAVQEHRLSGLELPAATLRAIEDCREEYWLIPMGAEPFDVPSAYTHAGPRTVFPQEFRAMFLRRYERRGETAHFTIWSCRGGS